MAGKRTDSQQVQDEIGRELGAMPEPVECEVEPLGAGWRLHFEQQRVVVEVPRTYWHSNGQVDANYVISIAPIVAADKPRRVDHGTLNLHSSQTRSRLAKHLAGQGHEAPWQAILDEFAARVTEMVTAGEDPVVLTDLDVGLKPDNRLLAEVCIDGEASMIFGHGGDGKSLVGLACGACLAGGYGLLDIEPAEQMAVAYLDWEWRPEEHARRLNQLLGPGVRVPKLYHFQCRRPLAAIVDGLAVKFRRYGIRYAIVDSVAWACGGAPEKSEMATAFQAALRQLRVGALCIAHTNRSGDTTMPFGSVFWWNAMRSIWFLKRVPTAPGTLAIEMHHRKTNSAELGQPMAYTLTWDSTGRVAIARGEVKRIPSLRERIKEALERVGLPMTAIELALAVGPGNDGRQPREETLVQALTRDGGKTFSRIDGNPPRWVLGGSFSFAGSHAREDNIGTPLEGAAATIDTVRGVQRQMIAEGFPAHAGEASSPEDTSGEPSAADTSSPVTDAGRSEQPNPAPRHDSTELSGERVERGLERGTEGEGSAGASDPADGLSAEVQYGRDLVASLREKGLSVYIAQSGRLGVGPKELVTEEVRALLTDPQYKALVISALNEERAR